MSNRKSTPKKTPDVIPMSHREKAASSGRRKATSAKETPRKTAAPAPGSNESGDEVWVASRSPRCEEPPSLLQQAKLPPTGDNSRLLHLADVALGQHKPDPFRRRSRSKVLGGN